MQSPHAPKELTLPLCSSASSASCVGDGSVKRKPRARPMHAARIATRCPSTESEPEAVTSDTAAEIAIVKQAAIEAGAFDAVLSNHWALGGSGAADMATSVKAACASMDPRKFSFLYPLEWSIPEKIEVRRSAGWGEETVG